MIKDSFEVENSLTNFSFINDLKEDNLKALKINGLISLFAITGILYIISIMILFFEIIFKKIMEKDDKKIFFKRFNKSLK